LKGNSFIERDPMQEVSIIIAYPYEGKKIAAGLRIEKDTPNVSHFITGPFQSDSQRTDDDTKYS
jgi:hypothetical protein